MACSMAGIGAYWLWVDFLSPSRRSSVMFIIENYNFKADQVVMDLDCDFDVALFPWHCADDAHPLQSGSS